jgi:hypothetical protein
LWRVCAGVFEVAGTCNLVDSFHSGGGDVVSVQLVQARLKVTAYPHHLHLLVGDTARSLRSFGIEMSYSVQRGAPGPLHFGSPYVAAVSV